EIENLLDRKPKALSGGQRQRVALGRAIVREAQIFLMDEPLSNLDAKLRSNMRSEIIKIHKQMKATTIYVTHDQTEAMTMASRIVILKQGEIQQIGTPEEIYRHPVNEFVATFIGSPSMNMVPMTYNMDAWYFDGQKVADATL
ncbi:ATP-binding cassette domain-containing protein, partial [Listeria monocytogenes]|nr:ATP-binding cassette domain-containing protein [Listeria monocytogenes]